jgi:preprotein translocase subunit SecF
MAERRGFRGQLRRLYRGETTYGFIAHRRRWYALSGIILLICLASMLLRGFNEGIEFKGGTQYSVPATGTSLSVAEVQDAFVKQKVNVQSVQDVGNSSTRQFIVRAPSKSTPSADEKTLRNAVESDLKIPQNAISETEVSSTWGSDISRKALQGLVFFLIIVSIYIAIRFQPRMAIAAIVALLHDLLLTAGVYSLVGFEVTPSTVVGLLTILGFSLYDTVVIFDKVSENTKDITAGSRMTFSEGTNAAVNQTLMRSINTSLISLLPVAGLLFIGAFLLGVGTIKDLALVMFVGLATGAYSSLFLAAPIVVDLTERMPVYKDLTKRVAAKRASEAARNSDPQRVLAGSGARVGAPAPAPRPGARPQRGGATALTAAGPNPPAGGATGTTAGAPAAGGTGRTAGATRAAGSGKPNTNRPKPGRRGKR